MRLLMLTYAALGLALSTSPATYARPCLIKGNINSKGDRIYHVPGSKWYARTRINKPGERWFCTEEEAIAAGWRPPLDQPLSKVAQRLWLPRIEGGSGSMMALMGSPASGTGGRKGCRIKGNINRRGECIYHVPGSR